MEKKQGQLVRSVSLLSATMLVVSSVIGSGVYKKVVPMSNELMSPDLVMAAWVLGGIISLFGALSNAEIASMMADSGGEYVYFRRIYGKFMAFLWGWSTFAVIKTAAIAGLSYVFAQSLNSIITFSHDKFTMFSWLTPLGGGGIQILAICLILVLTFINTRGLRGAELLSQYVTYFVIVGLSGIVICGLLCIYFRTICQPNQRPILPGHSVPISAVFGLSPIYRVIFSCNVS